MQRIAVAVLSTSLVFLSGCYRKPSAKAGRQMLIGNYALHIGSDCSENGIEYARLKLHPDGKYSQEGKFKSGVTYNIAGKKWAYNGDGNVFLYDLRAGPWLDISPQAEIGNASLIVEFGGPTLILLDPDKNCFFERTG